MFSSPEINFVIFIDNNIVMITANNDRLIAVLVIDLGLPVNLTTTAVQPLISYKQNNSLAKSENNSESYKVSKLDKLML